MLMWSRASILLLTFVGLDGLIVPNFYSLNAHYFSLVKTFTIKKERFPTIRSCDLSLLMSCSKNIFMRVCGWRTMLLESHCNAYQSNSCVESVCMVVQQLIKTNHICTWFRHHVILNPIQNIEDCIAWKDLIYYYFANLNVRLIWHFNHK